jgi:hypothetical protein
MTARRNKQPFVNRAGSGHCGVMSDSCTINCQTAPQRQRGGLHSLCGANPLSHQLSETGRIESRAMLMLDCSVAELAAQMSERARQNCIRRFRIIPPI